MPKAKPFTWIVRFTVAPLWVQDGFTIDNERALGMLARAVGAGGADELSAQVLETPSVLEIVRMQGYGVKDPRGGNVARELLASVGETGQIRSALLKARALLDSVAFVQTEGDTNDALDRIRDALRLIDARQGEPVEIEA